MATLNELFQKYQGSDDRGGDKGSTHSYLDLYSVELTKKVDVCLLEIGVYMGHSLMMWQEFFNGDSFMDNAFILGVDIDLSNLKFPVVVLLGDATQEETCRKIQSGFKWDYVIDDGSHAVEDQITTFNYLFPSLPQGAKYFIEDVTGDEGVEALTAAIPGGEVFDFRDKSGRWDDILYLVRKV